jgi:hypothetical protein
MPPKRTAVRLRSDALPARCERLEQILATLEKDGLRVPTGCRLLQYTETMRAFMAANRGPRDYDGEELLKITTAVGETAELLDTLERLLEPPAVEGWLPKMQKVVFGPFLPSKDHDPARNEQFELVVAASCRAAGGEPIFAEPDVRVRVRSRTLAIAAKRLSSLASFEKRVREARDQIRREAQANPSQQGIIAIDLTPALGLATEVRRFVDSEGLTTLYVEARRRTEIEGRRVGEWAAKDRCVRAAAAYTRFSFVWVAENQFVHVRPWHCGPVPAFGPTAAPLREFLGKWGMLGQAV